MTEEAKPKRGRPAKSERREFIKEFILARVCAGKTHIEDVDMNLAKNAWDKLKDIE